jgi:PAS domain S-box-containing protein
MIARDPASAETWLLSLPPTRGQTRWVVAVAVCQLAALALLAPFAGIPLGQMNGFIPAVEGVVFVTDLITSVLLFSQFATHRLNALLILACGYLLSALIIIPHALSFPGAFSPIGLPGGGFQTTPWLYFFWHLPFATALLGYGLMRNEKSASGPAGGSSLAVIARSIALVLALVCGMVLVATVGKEHLPALLADSARGVPANDLAIHSLTAIAMLVCVSALAVLWIRRRSVLDQWLMIVALSLILEIGIVVLLSPKRFDVGFYAGRLFSLLTSTTVLVVLLVETMRLYANRARSSEGKIRRLVDANIIGIIIGDLDGTIIDSNDAFLQMLGYGRDDVASRSLNWMNLVPAEWRKVNEERVAEIKSTGIASTHETQLFKKDGSRLAVLCGAAIFDEARGQAVAFVADLTERKQADEALRRSEAFLAKGQKLSQTGTFSWDFATEKFMWSDELYRIYEFEPGSQVTFDKIATRYHPEDKAIIAGVAEQARLGVMSFDYAHRLLMPNGSIKHIHVVAHGSRNEAGRIEYFGAVQDETQRSLADEARRLSEGRWKRIVDNSAIGIAVADLEGRFEIANAAFQKLIGFTEEELREMNFIDITESQFREHNSGLTLELLRGKRDQFNIEKQYRCKDGRVVWARNNVSLLPGPDGTPRNIMAIVEDISSRKAAEGSLRVTQARLARAAELATAAELSASIAHEINQPLSGIITNTNTCLRMLSADPPNVDGARETARRTLRDGNRASEIVTRLRALFDKKQPMLEMIDLNEAAQEVIALLSNGLQANHVVLRTDFTGDLSPVKGDRVQLQQVILNLIQNAIDSMTTVDDRIRQLQVETKRDEDDRVRLAVKDTGIGFASDAVERVFDSFYTTKGNGMGIGLAISRSIIEGHEGRLWVETNDGPGVTFSFSIPGSSKNPTGAGVLRAAPSASGAVSWENQHDDV